MRSQPLTWMIHGGVAVLWSADSVAVWGCGSSWPRSVCPMCSGGRRFHWSAGAVLSSSGRGVCSCGVEGLESFVGGGQVACPLPAGWDLQDLAAGVGDEAGWGAQEPVAQRFGFGFG